MKGSTNTGLYVWPDSLMTAVTIRDKDYMRD